MSTNYPSQQPSPEFVDLPELRVHPRRLWFGFAGSAAAWASLGCLDLLITWRACMHQENFGIPNEHPAVNWVYFGLALALLGVTLGAGILSYQNWRSLSRQEHLLGALAVRRGEFMAVCGVIVSVTLGAGIVWLALPPLFLDLCWRAR
jgi:hypothetical protein